MRLLSVSWLFYLEGILLKRFHYITILRVSEICSISRKYEVDILQ